jgi:hypothetical protein
MLLSDLCKKALYFTVVTVITVHCDALTTGRANRLGRGLYRAGQRCIALVSRATSYVNSSPGSPQCHGNAFSRTAAGARYYYNPIVQEAHMLFLYLKPVSRHHPKWAGARGQAAITQDWPLNYASGLLLNLKQPLRRWPGAAALLLWALSSTATDSRQIVTGTGLPWLRAVGKLEVPGQRIRNGRWAHYIENCSATLVSSKRNGDARIILSAWHCLEFYGDLSKPIVFTLATMAGGTLTREAVRIADGGSMRADWAILRLDSAVPARLVPGMTVHPQAADPILPVSMAGYSRDSGIGNHGEILSFDPQCAITSQQHDFGDTDCTAHKGASGGAVIQISAAGTPRLCGVISQGNGEGRSTFVPVSGFRRSLNHALRQHQP